MGQYFMAVNKTKKEYFRAWDMGGGAKLWEWCANPQAGVLPFLLRKSDESGGGDVEVSATKAGFAGRWAGDEVYLVGDYDSSHLYQQVKDEYINIAKELVREYNEFIGIQSHKLEYVQNA